MNINLNGHKYYFGLGLAVERTPKGSRFHFGLGIGTLTIALPWFAVTVRPYIAPEVEENGKI